MTRENPAPSTANGIRTASDFVGIGLSVLCLIHCLALPVLIAFAPAMLRGLPGDDVTHRSLAVAIALVGLLAFRTGYKVHRKRWVLGVFILGLLLVSTAAALGEAVLTGGGEAAITVCGGLLLVSAHFFNHSFCRSCPAPGCGPICSPNVEDMIPASSAGRDLAQAGEGQVGHVVPLAPASIARDIPMNQISSAYRGRL